MTDNAYFFTPSTPFTGSQSTEVTVNGFAGTAECPGTFALPSEYGGTDLPTLQGEIIGVPEGYVFTVNVTWGDGQSESYPFISDPAGTPLGTSFYITHEYQQVNGAFQAFPVKVTVTSSDQQSITSSVTAPIADPGPDFGAETAGR